MMQSPGRPAFSASPRGASSSPFAPKTRTRAGRAPRRPSSRIAAGLHGHRPGDALLRSRAGIHQPASNSLTEFARSTAWVRRRALILDMIAVMWVFTVASAIDNS